MRGWAFARLGPAVVVDLEDLSTRGTWGACRPDHDRAEAHAPPGRDHVAEPPPAHVDRGRGHPTRLLARQARVGRAGRRRGAVTAGHRGRTTCAVHRGRGRLHHRTVLVAQDPALGGGGGLLLLLPCRLR